MNSVLWSLFFFILTYHGGGAVGNCIWNGETRIHCDLNILDFRRNSSDVPSEASQVIEELYVDCSDVLYFESQLRSDHFGELSKLSTLHIHNCKVHTLPPRSFVSLIRLRELVIHTHNADMSGLAMDPDYESLVGLEALETLDLSFNNIRAFPPGLLCPLKSIRLFNASYNNITNLEDLGLRGGQPQEASGCGSLSSLESLVLRGNVIAHLPPGSLSSLTSLQSLDLSNNDLRVLLNDAFEALGSLKSLDLSENQLLSLPPVVFRPLRSLEALSLGNNSLKTLDPSLLSPLAVLKSLNLSGNALEIQNGIFIHLGPSLLLLDLSFNKLSGLADPQLFAKMANLQALNLDSNNIQGISSDIFKSTPRLAVLTLSRNQLETLPYTTLQGLDQLQSLFLDHNKIHSLQSGTFVNCTRLQKLKLNDNYLTQVPSALHDLKALTYLDLSGNVIGALKRESFKGLGKLQTLRIADNGLSRMGEESFLETTELMHLDLSLNRFKTLERETFKSLDNLQSLNLAENVLEDINGVLSSQAHLKWLNLSCNHIAWFDYAFLPMNLEWLDIHDNRIDSLANYFAIKGDYTLKYLDASYNKIRKLKPLSVLSSLTHLYLNDNDIEEIEANTFLDKRNLSSVHLERNNLSQLEMNSLVLSKMETINDSPTFYFEDNPFICDCHLQWFQGINTRLHHYPHVMDMDNLKCSSRRNSVYAVLIPLSDVQPEEFLCRYESHCFPSCMCCDFFACDCRLKCPEEEGCLCFRDSAWVSNVVRCSAKSLNIIPGSIPIDATSLHLDGNNFTDISSVMFIGRVKLTKLYLNNSRVSSIGNASFSGLPRLTTLDLSQNRIQELNGPEFSGLESTLRELYLQGNQLVRMKKNTFRNLGELRVLRLDGNLLISFPVWSLAHNPSLSSLSLAHNWWQCDCEFVSQFREFIDDHLDIVSDYQSITCTSRDGQTRPCRSGFFSSRNKDVGDGEQGGFLHRSKLAMILGGSLAFFLLLLIVGLCGVRERLRVLLHSKYGIRLQIGRRECSNESKGPIFFDVLLMYDQKHASMVLEEIGRKGLEPSYKCIYHQRDLCGNYHSEGFKSSLAASSNQVVVMSSHFVEFEWDAFQGSLDSKHLNDNEPKRIITILLESKKDILSSAGNERKKSEIRNFLRKDSKKVLSYNGDGRFWKEFRYYLKDPMFPSSREGGAELDRSGIWSFSNNFEEDPLDSSTTPMLANLLLASLPPPMKKKECSASARHRHSLSQLNPSLTTSGIVAAPAERVVQHQRSVSAIAGQSERRPALHGRSRSALAPTASRETSFIRPAPPRRVLHDRSASTIVESRRRSQMNIPLTHRNSLDYPQHPGAHHVRSVSTPFSHSNGFVL